jgi:NADH:ubiquinone oxidoreductase subunit K
MNLLNYKKIINYMQTWLNFWNIFFWFTLTGFLINPSNFIKLLFFSEVTWLTLYCYILITGAINDDLTLFSSSFFILGLAGLEYSIGLLLVIIFKNINKSLLFFDEQKNWNNYLYKNNIKLYINRYLWTNI